MATQRGPPQRKLGDQALKAMGSLGLEELRNSLYADSTIAQKSTEPGMYGERSYGDVAEDRQKAAGQEKSLLAEKIKEAEMARDGHEPKPPELTQE